MAAVQFPKPGPVGLMILRTAVAEGFFKCAKESQNHSARGLNGNGYLTRDPKDSSRWFPTEKASAMLAALEVPSARPAKAVAIVEPDMFNLVATVLRAQSLLDAGDVMAAKQLAGGAYLDAKARAQYAASFGASGKRVVAKARQLQGEALLIESRAKMSMAAAWKAAKADGLTHKGRPKSVPDENAFTAEEAGFTRKELYEATELLDAEEKAPGFAERAIAARVSAGLEPSRRSLKTAIGTKSATKEERGNNLYETPAVGTAVVVGLEDFLPVIVEPFCGRGAISRVLEAAGHEVILSDLVDYGTADQHGQLQQVRDFLTIGHDEIRQWTAGADFDIVSNPPYGELINACILHALTVIRPRKLALLLNTNFLCGYEDDDRNGVLDILIPARCIIHARRLPMMHRDGWDGKTASSQMNTMWLIWERNDDGSYAGEFRLSRAVYSDFNVPGIATAAAESDAA